MNTQQLIRKLNWFYSLELNQVELYQVQGKAVDDIYLKKLLERVAKIEQGHVDNISDYIYKLGGKPTVLGEAVAPVTGMIAGKVSSWAGVINMLKSDILLEQKAITDYQDLVLKVSDKDLFELLWSNLIDEDLHTAWFARRVEELAAMTGVKQ